MFLHNRKFELLISPKYHCELAGEGIEYSWGFAKKIFRRIPLIDKKGKVKFRRIVKKSLLEVTVDIMRKFSARARRYMLTYWFLDSKNDADGAEKQGLSYDLIESYVNKKLKTHRNAADQDKGFIASVWREAQTMGFLA